MLETQTCHQLVTAQIVGEVVVHGQNLVTYAVIIGEELVTQCHVGVTVLHNINHGEHRRTAATRVVNIRIGHQQLVRSPFAKTAVQVEREGCHFVLLLVERIGKSHRTDTYTRLAQSADTTRGSRGGTILRIVGMVEAYCQVMILSDVPVDTSQILVILNAARIVRGRTSVIAVLILDEFRNHLHVAHRST